MGDTSEFQLSFGPQATEDERALIGAIILKPKFLPLASAVTIEHFGDVNRRNIWRTILATKALSFLDVRQDLEKSGLKQAIPELYDCCNLAISTEGYVKKRVENILRAAGQRLAAREAQRTAELASGMSPAELADHFIKVGNEVRAYGNSTGDWRESLRRLFKTPSQMESGDDIMVIDGFLPEGIVGLGGPSGHGKTWVALSMARALVKRTKFLGHFDVREQVPVLYMVPEDTEKAFRRRLDIMGITDTDPFFCRTLKDGILQLDNPELLAICDGLHPVVFLDTAVRFNNSKDENSASENRGLSEGCFGLLRAGARVVNALHHSAKGLGTKELVDLESTFRGTSDFGAMLAAGYACIQREAGKNVVEVVCVKPRNIEPPPRPFKVQGRPFLADFGDLMMLEREETPEEKQEREDMCKIRAAIIDTPQMSQRQLIAAMKGVLGEKRVTSLLEKYAGREWQVESCGPGKAKQYSPVGWTSASQEEFSEALCGGQGK